MNTGARFPWLPLVFLFTILGIVCCVSDLKIDPSMSAVEANDLTLVGSACEGAPGRGMDICRVKEGQAVSSSWRIVVPVDGRVFLDGELTVYFHGVSKTYPITSPLIEIPWSDLVPGPFWTRDVDGEAMALAQIRWKTPAGLIEVWKARGIAKLIVTKEGYDSLPLDSGFSAWGTTCKIQYSTAGRSAIKCQ